MQIQLTNSPQMAIAQVILDPNEELHAQNGSLIAMSAGIQAQSLMRRSSSEGSKAQTSKWLQSKTLYLNTYRSGDEGGELYLAPALMGNLGRYQLSSHKLIIRQSSYLASSQAIEIFMGYRSPVKNETNAWLSLVGKGDIILSGFGAIYNIEVDGKYTLNADHIIAFENTLKFNLAPNQSPLPKILVPLQEILYEFHGTGKILCQTHRPFDFAQRIGRYTKPHNFKLH